MQSNSRPAFFGLVRIGNSNEIFGPCGNSLLFSLRFQCTFLSLFFIKMYELRTLVTKLFTETPKTLKIRPKRDYPSWLEPYMDTQTSF